MYRRCLQFGVLVSIISFGNGFNLSPNYAQVFQDPQGQSGSYFGYSIGLQRYKTGSFWSFWIVVGAPKANSTAAAHLDINEPGVVYRCTNSGARPGCRPVRLDAAANGKQVHASYLSYKERRDHSWTGATIEVSSEGGLLVCAPKWVNEYYTDEYLLNGICYWKDNLDADTDALKLMPLIHKNEQGTITVDDEDTHHTPTRRFLYSYGQAGFSAHITPDGQEMLLGAPGILDWIGSVIRCREQDEDIPFPSNRRKRQTKNFTDLAYDIPNPYDASKIDNNGYFGYAVSSGYFRNPNKLSFVGSAPREATLKGTVSIFEYVQATRIQVVDPLEGTQMGEYFGASVCVIDLNDDQLDDLVVGAPLHSLFSEQASRLTSGDEGRVYVFINTGNSVMREIGDANKIMGLQIPGARFGTCVSGVGDLNKDGFNDFAVGAPYEDEGRGAIYIYHGQRSGVNPKYSQRIGAQDIHPALTGFGYSISKGLDIDNNNYSDLAVGAYSSGHAVLIRSRPVIKLVASLGDNVGEIGINATGFDIKACLRYQGKNLPPTVAMQIFLSVASKTEIKSFIKPDSGLEVPGNSTYSFYTTLSFNKNSCRTVQVVLDKGTAFHEDNIDYTKPYEMKMSYILDERKLRPPKLPNTEHKGDTFCKNCPVVDPNDGTSTMKDVLYATGCTGSICRTDLSVTASFEESVRTPHKIGSLSTVRMKVVVDNSGESAFLARLTVIVAGSTPLVRIPSRCQEVDTEQDVRLECDIGNPLRSSSKAQIDLELSFKDLPSSLESLSYQFNATSAGSDENSENNARVLTLGLEAVADMEIAGVSTQNELVYLPENTQTFSHKYEVLNHGPSPASAVRLEFGIPFAYATGDAVIPFLEVYEPTVSLNEHRFSCKPQGQKFSVLRNQTNEEAADSSPRKRRAATSVESETSDSNPLLNTTFVLECSDPAVACLTVICDPVGPFVAVQSRALLSFKMRANLTKLAPVLNMKDTIVVSSWGAVTINPSLREKQPVGVGTRADTAVVATLFYGTIREQSIATWIWILAIVGGILILLIITGVLYKMGFFRRKGKEDLEVLKENDGLQLDSMNDESFARENETSPEDEKL